MSTRVEFIVALRKDLSRLSRFGANIADAHSCLIFIPDNLQQSFNLITVARSGNQDKTAGGGGSLLELGAFHSLSNSVVKNCRLSSETGLIGWVAKHKRSIHVSPFDRDSRTLGIYAEDQGLKSFIGVPIKLGEAFTSQHSLAGVITCDSKKSYAFSKLQGKLIENLAEEIANTIQLHLQSRHDRTEGISWQEFAHRSGKLMAMVGAHGIESLRLKLTNFEVLEVQLGIEAALQFIEQVYRLIEQALPPLSPFFRLPNGDLILLFDGMMGAFYENKILAICRHARCEGLEASFDCQRRALASKRGPAPSIDVLLAESCRYNIMNPRGSHYEYRRA